jgi:hypothetical protein
VRNSDRLATPAVVITMLAIGGILVGLTIVGVTYLTARHIDPEPVFKLVGIAVTGLSSLGALVLQLVNRSTVTKVERNTSGLAPDGVPVQIDQLASAVYDVHDALPRQARAGYEDTLLRKTTPAPPGR